jgi:signal transduction histidine kinase
MIGAKLWTELSDILGEKVTKKTVRAILESYDEDLKNGKLISQIIKPAELYQSTLKNYQYKPIHLQKIDYSWFNSDLLLQLTEKLEYSVRKALIDNNYSLSDVQFLLKKIQLIHYLSSPQYALHCEHLDMVGICRNLINYLQLDFPDRNIILSFFDEPILTDYDLSVNVLIDRNLIQNILENLLINALQYSDRKTIVTLDIDIEYQKIIFTVKDEGIGISDQELEQVFRPFYCATNTRQYLRDGLGLFIVERSVRLHQGEIFVSSQIKEGSIFRVILPVI